jgi:regulatory protein
VASPNLPSQVGLSVNASEQTVSLTASEVRVAALDLLARREHSVVELCTKLAKRFRARESDPDLIEQVIRQLVSDGLLSDQRFAVSRVRQLFGRGYGPARIRGELRRQQVDGLVSDSLQEAFDSPLDWTEAAATVYQKKYRGTLIVGDWDARQRERSRRLRFLQYRGFDADISQALVDADDRGGDGVVE